MNSAELVSVVMPVSGNPIFLENSIKSVLEQTSTNLELIIVFNAVQPWAIKLVESLSDSDRRVKYLITNEKGISNALNLGISASSGAYIARIDSDDLMKQNRIEVQLEYLLKNPEIGLIGSQIVKINQLNKQLGESRYPTRATCIRSVLPIRNCIAHPSVMIRKEVLELSGGYNPVYDGVEDYDLWLRLLDITQMENISYPLTYYRIWPEQITSNQSPSIENELQYLRKRYFINKRICSHIRSDTPQYNSTPSVKKNTIKNRKEKDSNLQNILTGLNLIGIKFLNRGVDRITKSENLFYMKLIGLSYVSLSLALSPKSLPKLMLSQLNPKKSNNAAK